VSEAPAERRLVLPDGRAARARRVGEGAPLVLVPGSGLGALGWGRLRPPGFSPVLIDFLGYGAADPFLPGVDDPLSVDVAAVVAAIDGAGGRVALVGHSYGGLVAWRAALARPDAVAVLGLCEPVCYGLLDGDAPGAALRAAMEARFPGVLDGGGPPDAGWLRGFIDYWNGPGAWDGLPESRRVAYLRLGARVRAEVGAVWGAPPPARFPGPTVVVRGADSPVEAREMAARAAAVHGGAPVVIPGVGHTFPLVAPGPTWAALGGAGWAGRYLEAGANP